MKTAKVRKLRIDKILLYFIQEREAVRLRKEAGKPPPWTDDEIIQNWRFCNIRRMDDKVSRWLMENWYGPYQDHANMLPAVCLARFLNQPTTLAAIGFPKRWQPEKIKDRVRDLQAGGATVFNPAYMVRGNDGVDKIETVVDYTIQPLVDDPPRITTSSMRQTWLRLLPRYGMGSFMAGQITADLRWALAGDWNDAKYWAPMGPGSRKGLARVLYGDDWVAAAASYDQDSFLQDLQTVVKMCREKLPAEITNRLEMHDWQNVMCEVSGYFKVLYGEGRKKQRYLGV